MGDKKIKYVLSDFMLDGGAKGAQRARGKGKSGKPGNPGKSASTKRGFGQPPDNMDPNGSKNQGLYNNEDAFTKLERRRLERLETKFPTPPWCKDKFPNDPDSMM